MSQPEESPLAIGAVFGDSDAQSLKWQPIIGGLHMRSQEIGRGLRSPLSLNVVFHLTGRLSQPEFEGVRTGSFFRAKNLQVVQAAIWDINPPDKQKVLFGLLNDSVDAAENKFAKKSGSLDLMVLRTLITSMEND